MVIALLSGCLEGRTPVAIDVGFTGSEAPPGITLSQAQLEMADLRLLAPAPTAWLPPLLFGNVAHAHPGHDFAGPVRGELLGTWTVDLREVAALGRAEGFTGRVDSAELVVRTARLEGSADGVPFALDLEVGQSLEGVPALLDLDGNTGPLEVVFDMAAALAFVDWVDRQWRWALERCR